MKKKPGTHIAYFSMEVAFANEMRNYAGGLGVLAGDMLMSASDMGYPLVGVSLFYHEHDDPVHAFCAERYLTRRPETVEVEIENRRVTIGIWEKMLVGQNGTGTVPVYFLSAHLPENKPWDRDLTKHLYANDRYTRLGQEIILGIGGVRTLKALGYNVSTYHLNEGHAAFATLELLRTHAYDESKVRSLVTFTTHTPIAAGHDHFDYTLAGNTLRDMMPWNIRDLSGADDLNMTALAMSLSKSTNSVSEKHKKVCEAMFPGNKIANVTNGVYAPRWARHAFAELFNRYFPGWREDPTLFAKAVTLPTALLRTAKNREKESLISWINLHKNFFAVNNVSTNDHLENNILTIGFARRFVSYKRPDLIFKDIERLARIGNKKLQLIFANRCHPDDSYCNDQRAKFSEYAERLRGSVRIVLIPDYDLNIAERLVAGCDLWLNTPIAPHEASGTSGMKAALNGTLNLSIRDGWWIEGLARSPLAGWGFGGDFPYESDEERNTTEAGELLSSLKDAIDCYYAHPNIWAKRMKHAISLMSYFNTTRVIKQYDIEIWGRCSISSRVPRAMQAPKKVARKVIKKTKKPATVRKSAPRGGRAPRVSQ